MKMNYIRPVISLRGFFANISERLGEKLLCGHKNPQKKRYCFVFHFHPVPNCACEAKANWRPYGLKDMQRSGKHRLLKERDFISRAHMHDEQIKVKADSH